MPRYYPKMSLRDRIATAEGKRRFVRGIFATIADRYDFITVVLSYGQDRRWKRRGGGLGRPSGGPRGLGLATRPRGIAFARPPPGARVAGPPLPIRLIQPA